MAQNKSVAFHHFPQIVWRDGKKHLWNPIHRKALKNLPEERVRLRIVEYLLHGGWSKHRISTEEAINLPQSQTALRTDLICYTKDITPFLLVECKAENVKLSEKTAEQIARYNQSVQAPYLLMTNGQTDHWYGLNEQSAQRIDDIPGQLPASSKAETNFSYWQSRGFVGKNAAHTLRQWLLTILESVWFADEDSTIRYLNFDHSPGDLELATYYRIYPMDNHRLALSFTATAFGSTRMIGILNRNSNNEAVLEVNLDFLFDDRTPNASVYWGGDTKNLDIRSYSQERNGLPTDPKKVAGILSAAILDVIE